MSILTARLKCTPNVSFHGYEVRLHEIPLEIVFGIVLHCLAKKSRTDALVHFHLLIVCRLVGICRSFGFGPACRFVVEIIIISFGNIFWNRFDINISRYFYNVECNVLKSSLWDRRICYCFWLDFAGDCVHRRGGVTRDDGVRFSHRAHFYCELSAKRFRLRTRIRYTSDFRLSSNNK